MSIADECIAVLAELGPMAASLLADELGYDRDSVRKAMQRVTGASRPREAHVKAWITVLVGERACPRQVYAAGDGPNANRPKPKSRSAIVRDWRRKKHAMIRGSSAFNWGVPQRESGR